MNRNVKYDNLKFFLIFCVAWGHMGQFVTAKGSIGDLSYSVARTMFWVYLFHIPAFTFISGMFSRRTVNEARWNRFVPYLFLYLFMKVLRFGVDAWLKGIDDASLDFFRESGTPWFLLAMFWWFLVTILIRKVHPVYVMVFSLILAASSGYSSKIGELLVLQRAIIFYPFFYLGYLTDPEALSSYLSRWKVRIASILVLAASIAYVFTQYEKIIGWRRLFRGMYNYKEIAEGVGIAADNPAGCLWRLAAYAISILLTMAVISLTPSFRSYMTVIGRKTLAVMVFHTSLITLALRQNKDLRKWVSNTHIALRCLIFTAAVVFITSLPVFDWLVKRVMRVPGRKEIPGKE